MTYSILIFVAGYVLGLETVRAAKWVQRLRINYKADKFYKQAVKEVPPETAAVFTSKYKEALAQKAEKPDEVNLQRDKVLKLSEQSKPWPSNHHRLRTKR